MSRVYQNDHAWFIEDPTGNTLGPFLSKVEALSIGELIGLENR